MNLDEINKANKLYNDDSLEELYGFIRLMIGAGDPHAMYFYSKFSLEEWGESDKEYDERYFSCLRKAAEGGVAGAMYRLSTLYSVGDIVELDNEKANRYLESALKLGYGPAKLTLGINLFYGSNGYRKDLDRAAMLIAEAENDNVEGASEFLREMLFDQRFPR